MFLLPESMVLLILMDLNYMTIFLYIVLLFFQVSILQHLTIFHSLPCGSSIYLIQILIIHLLRVTNFLFYLLHRHFLLLQMRSLFLLFPLLSQTKFVRRREKRNSCSTKNVLLLMTCGKSFLWHCFNWFHSIRQPKEEGLNLINVIWQSGGRYSRGCFSWHCQQRAENR